MRTFIDHPIVTLNRPLPPPSSLSVGRGVIPGAGAGGGEEENGGTASKAAVLVALLVLDPRLLRASVVSYRKQRRNSIFASASARYNGVLCRRRISCSRRKMRLHDVGETTSHRYPNTASLFEGLPSLPLVAVAASPDRALARRRATPVRYGGATEQSRRG